MWCCLERLCEWIGRTCAAIARQMGGGEESSHQIINSHTHTHHSHTHIIHTHTHHSPVAGLARSTAISIAAATSARRSSALLLIVVVGIACRQPDSRFVLKWCKINKQKTACACKGENKQINKQFWPHKMLCSQRNLRKLCKVHACKSIALRSLKKRYAHCFPLFTIVLKEQRLKKHTAHLQQKLSNRQPAPTCP